MYLKMRQREIIQKCIHHPDITVQELEQMYKVSRRTIYDDIASIKDWAIENGIRYELEGRRIFEIRDPDSLLRVQKLLKDLAPFAAPLNQCSRVNLILAHLFFEDDSFTILQLCEKIGISRSTFYRDLDAVVMWLEPFDLTLEIRKNKGVRIQGRESRRRDAMVSFIKGNFDSVELLGMVLDGRTAPFFSNEKDCIFHMVKRYFEDADLQTIRDEMEVLQNTEEEPGDYRMIYFIWLMLISRKREKTGFSVELGWEWEPSESDEIFRAVLEKLGFGEEEQRFLSFYFKTIHGENPETEREERVLEDRISLFLDRMEKLTGCPLRQDLLLEESLKLHVKTSGHRLAMGIKDANPLLEEIKVKFPELSRLCRQEIQTQNLFGTGVGEHEISYVVIYIAAAMERMEKSRKRVFAVCTTGKGSAQLLEISLKKHFPELEVLGTISIQKAAKVRKTEADAIISTARLEETEVPVICVSPLLLPQDVSHIRKVLNLRPAKREEKPGKTGEMEPDSFFQLMYMMSDCAAAVEELSSLWNLQLSNTVYIALLIHLMMQLHQGIGLEKGDIKSLDSGEQLIFQVTERLYRKYGRHVSRYDLDSIKMYLQGGEEMR